MRNPKPDPLPLYGAIYADTFVRDLSAEIAPLALPQTSIRIADLFA